MSDILAEAGNKKKTGRVTLAPLEHTPKLPTEDDYHMINY